MMVMVGRGVRAGAAGFDLAFAAGVVTGVVAGLAATTTKGIRKSRLASASLAMWWVMESPRDKLLKRSKTREG
jgi:hypothetical protein